MSDPLHPKSPKKRGPVPIGEVIKSLRWRVGREARKQEEVGSLWQKVAGKKMRAHTKIQTLADGTLTVLIDSSSSLYELSLEKGPLLQKLQKELGPERIKEIRFQLGNLLERYRTHGTGSRNERAKDSLRRKKHPSP